jgi:hypothetical protein
MVTWAGNISPTSKTKKSQLRPGNSRRAKAKAASVQVTSWPTVTTTAIITEFQ